MWQRVKDKVKIIRGAKRVDCGRELEVLVNNSEKLRLMSSRCSNPFYLLFRTLCLFSSSPSSSYYYYYFFFISSSLRFYWSSSILTLSPRSTKKQKIKEKKNKKKRSNTFYVVDVSGLNWTFILLYFVPFIYFHFILFVLFSYLIILLLSWSLLFNYKIIY